LLQNISFNLGLKTDTCPQLPEELNGQNKIRGSVQILKGEAQSSIEFGTNEQLSVKLLFVTGTLDSGKQNCSDEGCSSRRKIDAD